MAAVHATITATVGCPRAEPHSYFCRRQPSSILAFLRRRRPVAPRMAPFRWEFLPPVINAASETPPYRNGGFGAVPASGRAISDLLQITVGEAREKDCSVCMEAFGEGETLKRMPCAHAFHEGCISDWLRVSRLCPLCRFALPTHQDEERMRNQ